jgi:FKBP-type peptidyl-prolyl cis-trans isomerase
MRPLIFIILVLSILLVLCKRTVQEIPPDFNGERIRKKEALIRLNKYIVRRNQDLIERFVERTDPDMKKTETGLWYRITTTGNARKVKKGDVIEYSCIIKLLDGTFQDSVSVFNPKSIKIGQGGVESGLEEAFLLMHEGDQARFIIPPHLAFGNFGYGTEIPPGAIIIYDVSLLKVHN